MELERSMHANYRIQGLILGFDKKCCTNLFFDVDTVEKEDKKYFISSNDKLQWCVKNFYFGVDIQTFKVWKFSMRFECIPGKARKGKITLKRDSLGNRKSANVVAEYL